MRNLHVPAARKVTFKAGPQFGSAQTNVERSVPGKEQSNDCGEEHIS